MKGSSLLVLFIGTLGLAGCDARESRKDAVAPAPPKVIALRPTVKAITEWDEYTGRFAAIESVEIRARVSGYLTGIHFKDGQIVQAGDRLFTIDQRPFQTAAAAAEADVSLAEATRDFARRELGRAETLRPSGSVPERLVEERATGVSQSAARVLLARSALERAKLDLEFTNIRAPITGRIDSRRVSVGNLISGGGSDTSATLLTTIVSIDPMHVVFDIDQGAYLRYARAAMDGSRPSSRDTAHPVLIGLSDDAAYAYPATMDFLSNQVDRASATVRARAIVDNKSLMFTPGLFARVRLVGRGPHEAILIPDEAVGTDQASRIVYVVKNRKAELRTVTLGPIVDGLRVVRTGLLRDDLIVTSGLQRIRPNQEVAVENGDGKAPGDKIADGESVEATLPKVVSQ